VEILDNINNNKDKLVGLKIIKEPPYLRHFTAELIPMGE
jgi:tryptophanase